MNPNLKAIQDLFLQNKQLTEQEKEALLKAIADADKQWNITEFKLDRTEKVKKTTAILLEETIEELEHKREAIEVQNRELEIEAALERVRAVAMGMKEPADMLEICRTISRQLELLHVKEIRNVQTAIFYEDKGTYMNYEYYAKHDKTFITETSFTNHTMHQAFAAQMLKGKDEFFTTYISKDELPAWIAYQKTTNVFIDTFLETASSLTYYWFSLGPVALGISTYEPLTTVEQDLFKRFLKVFELAYRRYLDIESALAQARESQIQLALERVRARTMAMQKSDELSETAYILFQQFRQLGDIPLQITIGIFNEEKGVIEFRITGFDGTGSKVDQAYEMDIHEPVLLDKLYTAWKEQKKSVEVELTGKEMRGWVAYRNKISGRTESASTISDDERRFVGVGFFSKGLISFSKPQPIENETINILERFAGVFDQTYTRFLDLQKAEAQARESQIQLALERVRARTMAMQKSIELKDAAMLLFQQVAALGVPSFACGFNIWDDDRKAATAWMAGEDRLQPPFKTSTAKDIYLPIYKAAQKGESLFIREQAGKELESHYAYLTSIPEVKAIGEELLGAGLSWPKFQVMHCAFFSQGYLMFITYKPVPEVHDIFKRFAKVFEQTYTRFLDLQKAEAQAREAQIEAALERVRGRSMAMHRSSDLHEVVKVVTEQLMGLGIKFNVANFASIHSSGGWDLWISAPDQAYPAVVEVPYIDHGLFNNIIEAIRNGRDFVADAYDQDEKNIFFKHFFENTVAKNTPEARKEWVMNCKGFARSVFLTKNIWLAVSNYDGIPFGKEENAIFKRFANAFEQTYTRFLDLQKAESQARESQIQLALERVRARTMAMHQSEELAETAQVLFYQLKELGDIPDRITIGVVDETAGLVNFWLTDQAGSHIDTSFKARLNEPTVMVKTYKAWKENKRSLVIDLHGNDLKKWIQFVRVELGLVVKDEFIKDRRVHNLAFFSHGWILFTTHEPQSAETIQILERFASVFNLTYRRFLDLQKAEEQAREAQIQLALERVRARTMAMQKSDELSDAVYVLFQQFKELGENPDQATIGIINEDEKVIEYWVTMYGQSINKMFRFSIDEPNVTNKIYTAWKENKRSLAIDLSGKTLAEFMEYRASKGGAAVNPNEKRRIINVAFFSKGLLNVQSNEERSEESIKLLERFAAVFDQTYTRFLDLQKAEAQAREAEIELALERVRARTMAMQYQNDLLDVTDLFAEQLIHLGVDLDTVNFSNGLSYGDWDLWVTSPTGETTRSTNHMAIPWLDHPYFEKVKTGLDNFKEGIDLNVAVFSKTEKDSFLDHVFTHTIFQNLTDEARGYLYNKPGFTFSTIFLKETWVSICKYDTKPFTDEQHAILRRFANTFGQAYTRFLDLQKAEAQAREAQIEAALERVRSRSLAMHKSEELQEVVHTVFEKLRDLDVDFYTVIIIIFQENSKDIIWWMENKLNQQYPRVLVRYRDIQYLKDLFEARESGNEVFSKCYFSEEKNALFKYLLEDTDLRQAPEKQKKFLLESEIATMSVAFAKNTAIHITSYSSKEFSEKDNEILKRFAKVFDQAYTRFLDLQKAEAQAREAQIEAALEKVRSRTTGMQKSDELREVIQMVFEQLRQLGFNIDSAHFNLNYKESNDYNLWSAAPGQPYPVKTYIPYFDHPVFTTAKEAKEKGLDFFTESYTKAEKNRFFEHLFKHIPVISEERKKYILSGEGVAASTVLMNTISLWIMNYAGIPYTEAENAILKRFGKIFEQSHTRFLDLQKAEIQAREAQIEAALERVRSKVMSMRSSEDLNETIKVFYHQLESLHLTPRKCGVGLLNKENRTAELSTINTTADGQTIELIGKLDMTMHPVLEGVYNGWLKQQEYHPVLRGNEIKAYYKILRPQIHFPDYPDDAVQYGYFFFFDEGSVYAWTENEMEEAELQIYRRFTSVLNLTYKRYKDLKQAEANAKEAVKQAALDRIRADIASMRSVSDLDRITPLIWNELTVLGIPFIRCGVFLMDDELQLIHTFLSAPDGKAIAAFHMPYDTPGKLGKVVSHWQEKKSYIDHWSGNEFMGLADVLVKQGSIANREEYLASLPDDGFYLHFLPFLQGMLYAGNTNRLGEEEIKLLQSVADAFSTAYARYEDFNKLEAAKKQVDVTLNELQATQKQLIQSEKMASLGELTAGIAHEIQNPLNFVNNFSEVNRELITELVEEVDKGNTEEVKAIAKDIRDNEEKISHHGRRADSIVKGMLQHSRKSEGVKELTDINALCDEYLRLSYHGLRAKDKSFNADFKTDFDETVGKINVVAQDIGRVLLNLFNNAFYAVNEKRKSHELSAMSYEPLISVKTKRSVDKIEIKVSDNGSGIPQNIVDKIFQPFFTTKPTGQGTGLGLSLAYDIIKAHGGEIKVNTREGVGSEFVMQLPI